MGVMWGLISVAIASLAQLSLGFSMMRLPSIEHPLAFIAGLGAFTTATLALFAGLAGYLIPVSCWQKTLHSLALSKTYALLSLSYALVRVVTRSVRRFLSKSDARRIVHCGGDNADFPARQLMMACASTAAIRRRNNIEH